MCNIAVPEAMRFEPDELLNGAIMSGIPVMIVEGHDDVPFYERLAASERKECDIYASENLSGVEGCDGVIGVISTIRGYSEGIRVEDYVLGIIDRDTRAYREQVPEDPAILMLELYSIESHFVSKEAVRLIVHKATSATGALFKEDDAEKLFESIKEKLTNLYLISLEALKGACDSSYEAKFGYSDKIKSIIGKGYPGAFELEKVIELNLFADSKNVNSEWLDILRVSKGKWILELFMDELKSHIAELRIKCKDNAVAQCQYCVNDTFNKCLYKINGKYTTPLLIQAIFQEAEQESLRYIKSRISNLK